MTAGKPKTALVLLPSLKEAVVSMRDAADKREAAEAEAQRTYDAWSEAGHALSAAREEYDKAAKVLDAVLRTEQ